MPESYRYAFAVTLSLDHSLTPDEQKMFKSTIKDQVKDGWYAVVFEEDDNGRLHAHAGQIFQWARTCGNVRRGSWWKHSYWGPILAENKYGIKVKEMQSDHWIANYMQKDGQLTCCNMPQNFEDVKQYFPDTNTAKKSCNPEFERWERMYVEEKRLLPCTRESVEEFFTDHFYVMNDLRIVTDPKKMCERCYALASFINKAPLGKKLTKKEYKSLSFVEKMQYDLADSVPPKRPKRD